MEDCPLCQPLADHEIWRSTHWLAIANLNQNTLGKCFLVLDRHEEDVCALTPAEVQDLWSAMRVVRAALETCFQPDHFNYSFLMNRDAHVHLHVIPRYQTARAFAEMDFADDESIRERRLTAATHRMLVARLRAACPQ